MQNPSFESNHKSHGSLFATYTRIDAIKQWPPSSLLLYKMVVILDKIHCHIGLRAL
jgi:hypothetical protein